MSAKPVKIGPDVDQIVPKGSEGTRNDNDRVPVRSVPATEGPRLADDPTPGAPKVFLPAEYTLPSGAIRQDR